MEHRNPDYDYAFVGGGLSAGLAALALLARHPDVRIAVVEREHQLGGNHTWCFHAADVPAPARAFVEPLIAHRWEEQEVRFPRRKRRLQSPYACITSQSFRDGLLHRLSTAPGVEVMLGQTARELTPRQVTLEGGQVLSARVVVDARGPVAHASSAPCGYQKFVGLELELEAESAPRAPLLMDACLPQHDGFRFMYVLPFAPDRVLVEETFFSESSALHQNRSEAAILAYARAQGHRIRRIVRTETGVLPMPFQLEPPSVPDGVLRAGYRGGYFHPVTGYSFPVALRWALALSESHPDPRAPDSALRAFATRHGRQLELLLTLTRMMFQCFEPDQRCFVLEHFYRLPEAVIERFYAAELGAWDRARLFLGAPPRGISLRRVLGLPHEATP